MNKEYDWKAETLAEIDARMYSPPTHDDRYRTDKYKSIVNGTDPDFELFTDLVGGEDWMTDDEKDAYS